MAVMDFQSTRVAIFWQRKPSDSEAEDILDVFFTGIFIENTQKLCPSGIVL